MANSFGSVSPRRPDIVMEELATLLSSKTWFEFKPLFDILHANLKERNSASGGEEMLRLRAYEKLQNLVSRGMVKKTVANGTKKYLGLASLSSVMPGAMAASAAVAP